MDVPAGVTQEEGNTGFYIHLLSAVLALIFLARRIQPFLSLVDREVEFCVLTIQSFSTRWAFLFSFFSFSVRKIPFAGIELTSQRVRGYMVPLSYRGDRLVAINIRGINSIYRSTVDKSCSIGNLTRLIHTLLYVMTIHTYIQSTIFFPFENIKRESSSSLTGWLNVKNYLKLTRDTGIIATSTLHSTPFRAVVRLQSYVHACRTEGEPL